MIQSATQKLIAGQPLAQAEVEAVAESMMAGHATPVQMAAFLTALHMRGETFSDVVAFARTLRARAVPFKRAPGVVLDTCGTGGDHSGTFNISTAAAFVAAGAGVRVAKHGNRSMTSKCGSADVLSELGVNTECEPSAMEQALEEVGICFLFAQKYHQSMRHVAPVRRELGFRTVFNMLGPLANPAAASHQLIGVFRDELVDLIARVLAELQAEHAFVVHGADGLDEITTTGPTRVAEVAEGEVHSFTISPVEFGFEPASLAELAGADAPANAKIIRDVLSGKSGPQSDIVLMNAGAAIFVADSAGSLSQGVEKARESIASGRALEKLEQLAQFTQSNPGVASA